MSGKSRRGIQGEEKTPTTIKSKLLKTPTTTSGCNYSLEKTPMDPRVSMSGLLQVMPLAQVLLVMPVELHGRPQRFLLTLQFS